LVGGAIGFSLFDQLIYTGNTPDLFFLILALTMTASLGGIAGFLLTLSIDLANASYRKHEKWRRYLVGGFSGILAFMVVLLMYANLNYIGDDLIQVLKFIPLEASAWGLAIGLGTTWGMNAKRPVWIVTPVIALVSGLILLSVEIQIPGGALVNDAWKQASSMFRVFLAGFIMPLLYTSAAFWGRRNS
jgi:hypothetical protein